jgi:anaerobic selenocysteine-containing dehydrogenase
MRGTLRGGEHGVVPNETTAADRVVVSACPLDCPDACSLEVTVRGDRVVAVDAVPADRAVNPLTQGFICAKVKRYGERVHAPERVTQPLVRTGRKGSGEFREASWDEAIGLVADRLRAAASSPAGVDSVLPYLYSSSAGLLGRRAGISLRLWDWFGAPWVEHTICAATYGAAWDAVYPGMASVDPLDVPHARLLVVWGANPTVSNTHLLPLMAEARAAGADLVVIDPRRTGVAQRARWHLAVRPGTDAVLALAMARHAAEQDLIDRAFVAAHVDGVEAFLRSAEPWTLARAADVCGVSAADIAEVTEAWATTRPAMLRVGYGMERNRNGGHALRTALALPALFGSFSVRGSGVLGSLSPGRPVRVQRVPPPWDHGRPPRRVVNQNQLGALLVGEDVDGGPPVSVLFVQGANPVAMNPAQGKVIAGLEREDLFTVVHEQVMTDTAMLADVVLPAATHLEALDVAVSYGSATLQEMPPVIPRVGSSRTNDEVAAALAAALGYPAEHFDADAGRLLDTVIQGPRTQVFASLPVQFVDTFPRDGRVRLQPVDHPMLPAPASDPDARCRSSSSPRRTPGPSTRCWPRCALRQPWCRCTPTTPPPGTWPTGPRSAW